MTITTCLISLGLNDRGAGAARALRRLRGSAALAAVAPPRAAAPVSSRRREMRGDGGIGDSSGTGGVPFAAERGLTAGAAVRRAPLDVASGAFQPDVATGWTWRQRRPTPESRSAVTRRGQLGACRGRTVKPRSPST